MQPEILLLWLGKFWPYAELLEPSIHFHTHFIYELPLPYFYSLREGIV